MTDCVIRSRIEPRVKVRATKILSSMGLNISDAIRIFLHQLIIQEEMPFIIKSPNAETIKAMKAIRKGKHEEVTLKELKKQWDDS